MRVMGVDDIYQGDNDMINLTCDVCGKPIKGAYKEVFDNNTEEVYIVDAVYRPAPRKQDICIGCWNFYFDQHKRIPLVNFPNSEVDDGKEHG